MAVTTRVTNQGVGNASGFQVAFYNASQRSSPFAIVNVGPLNTGNTSSVISATWSSPSLGPHDIRVEAEDVLTGARRHTNSCYLTYVAIDQAGRPVAVRPVVPETDEERARYKAAEVRRAQRIAERTAKGV